jgi:hypothetical protein
MSAYENVEFKIQGPRGFARDAWHNRRWILWTWLGIFVWVAVSSTAFHLTEYSAQIAKLNENPRTAGFDFPPWSSIYFTFINLTTVGFGDILPLTDAGRAIAVVNSLVGLVAFGMIVAQITAGFQPAQPKTEEIIEAFVSGIELGGHLTVDGRTRRYRIILEPIDGEDREIERPRRS